MISAITNKITTFLLVFILYAHNINTLVIIGDFMVNQAIIAKNLCVQKDNQKGCNGKCQLTKELKQSTPESNSDLPAQETRRLSLDVFCWFQIRITETQGFSLSEHKNTPNFYLQNTIETYLEIDTPPPNFS